MALARYEGVAQDAAGNVIPNATVDVRQDRPGRPVVPLWADRNGTVPLGNPITTDERGQFGFHVIGGVYYIRVFTGPSQQPFQQYTRRYQAIGTAGERDVEELASSLEAGTATFSTLDLLELFVPDGEGIGGKVTTGVAAGYYHYDPEQDEGERWVFDRPLYDSVARMTVTGGTANAITASIDNNVEGSAVVLMILTPEYTNSGPVTLNAIDLLSFDGSALEAGWLHAGTPVQIYEDGDGKYRLAFDHRFSTLAAQIAAALVESEAARDKAEEWAENAEDVPVEIGRFSAKHHAAVAELAKLQAQGERNLAETARTQTVAAKTDAFVARDSAQHAAEVSGDVRIFDTKALANAAAGALPNLQVVEVTVDESKLGQRTRYRKESGVLVEKLTITAVQPSALQFGAPANNATDVGTFLNALIGSAISDEIDLGRSYDLATSSGGYVLDSQVFIPREKSVFGGGIQTKINTKASPSLEVLFAVNTDGSGLAVSAYPNELSSKISNFYIDAMASYPTPLVGFDYVGGQHFHNIKARGIQTLIRQGDASAQSFSDLTRIERIGILDQPTADGYAIDLGYSGDGVHISQVLAFRHYDDGADGAIDPASGRRVRLIRLKYKTGATIENILNGDIYLVQCDAISLRSLHMEDGLLTFSDCSGTLTDATFWMRSDNTGELSITPLQFIYDSAASVHPAMVTVRDVAFVYHQGFRAAEVAASTKDNFLVQQSPAPFQGNLIFENVYRAIRLTSRGPAFGQKVGVTCSMPDFDDYSHIASLRSSYTQNRWIISADLGDLPSGDPVLLSASADTDFKWQGASGTYYYRAQLLLDKKRLIGIPGSAEFSATVTNGGDAPVAILTAVARKNAIIRLYRGTATGSYDSYVDVPMLAGARLADSGLDVCGYAWTSRTAGAMSAINGCLPLSYSLRPGETSAASDAYGNVNLVMRSQIAPTTGAWRRGDYISIASPTNTALPNLGKQIVGYRRVTSCTLGAPANAIGTDWIEEWAEYRPGAAPSSQFLSAASGINLVGKFAGQEVFDSTLGKPLWSRGTTSTAVWVDAAGTTVHTPA